MNRHFEDAVYYLRRAGEHAKTGVREELEPIETRLRELTGREKEPEAGRLETIQSHLRDVERRVESKSRRTVERARRRARAYRGDAEREAPIR